MNRRSLFKLVVAAPLLSLFPWLKPKPVSRPFIYGNQIFDCESPGNGKDILIRWNGQKWEVVA